MSILDRKENKELDINNKESEREANLAFKEFSPQSTLKLDDELVKSFDDRGLHIGWVRYKIKGDIDTDNISKKKQRGFRFVTPDEVKGSSIIFDNVDNNVVLQDLVLMAQPIGAKLGREAYFRKMSQNSLEENLKEMEKTVSNLVYDKGDTSRASIRED